MEDSMFLEFFGKSPFFRIIDFLIENRHSDYSKTEIAQGAKIGWSTLFKIWNRLEENNIVIKTRAYGNTKLYKLNTKNPIVKNLLQIELNLIELTAPKEAKEVALVHAH